jgi:putative metallohydrolase (TIGR04338 family)
MPKNKNDQTQRLYKAENYIGHILEKKEVWTLEECQKYVDKLLKKKRIQDNYPWAKNHKIFVTHGGTGRRMAYATFTHRGATIKLPPWARNQYVVLHEVAHHLDCFEDGHTETFATILLDLVRREMGKEKAELLQASYHLHSVKVQSAKKAVKARCPQSKKEWVAEQRQTKTERKSIRQTQNEEKEQFKLKVANGEEIKCWFEDCTGSVKGDVALIRWSRERVQFQWNWTCPRCERGRWEFQNRQYDFEEHGILTVSRNGVWR